MAVLQAQADALVRTEALAAENTKLRQVAGRRKAALAQSRQFLDSYLKRSAAMLAEQQAGVSNPDPDPDVGAGAAPAEASPVRASSNGARAVERAGACVNTNVVNRMVEPMGGDLGLHDTVEGAPERNGAGAQPVQGTHVERPSAAPQLEAE